MAKKKQPVPDTLGLIEIMYEAAEHATRHLRSAQILLAAGEWPDSFVLATLAFEELGKAHLCLGPLIMRPEHRLTSEEIFQKSFAGHTEKLKMAHFALIAAASEAPPPAAAQLFRQIEELAKSSNETKFRGLYVDYTSDGPLLPTVVSEEDARWMVGNVQLLLDTMRQHLLKDPKVFALFLEQWHSHMDFDALEAMEPGESISVGRSILRRGPTTPIPDVLAAFWEAAQATEQKDANTET
ncbi:AbiV family abortive infection protein [Streptomyces sp. NBC_01463]